MSYVGTYTVEKVMINTCPRCPFFSRGHNDPSCGRSVNVSPNSGAFASDGPPSNCPLRKAPVMKHYMLTDEAYYGLKDA